MAEYNRWSRGVHQGGDTCSHVKDPSGLGAEEEDMCEDCLSGSPSSGGSSPNINGKGKKKKGKNKEKKVRSWKRLIFCFYAILKQIQQRCFLIYIVFTNTCFFLKWHAKTKLVL